MRYDDLLSNSHIANLVCNLLPVPFAKRLELKKRFSNLHDDYLDFLTIVGYGIIGRRQYMLYDGVLTFQELLADNCKPELADLLIFGDDLSGSCHGFDPANAMQIFTVDMEIQDVESAGKSFEAFIRDLLARLADE